MDTPEIAYIETSPPITMVGDMVYVQSDRKSVWKVSTFRRFIEEGRIALAAWDAEQRTRGVIAFPGGGG